MARKPKGHKKSCRCPFCKRARKGGGSSKSRAKGKRHASPKRHRAELRRELREAKRGEAAAARQGNAQSWAKFKGAKRAIEAHLARK